MAENLCDNDAPRGNRMLDAVGQGARSPRPIPEPRAREGSGDQAAVHRIVVVGGCAAGLGLATLLGNRLAPRPRAALTLVACAPTHLWAPLPHSGAAATRARRCE